MILAATTCLSALYGGGWRTRLCNADVAAPLVGVQQAFSAEGAVWVAVDREPGVDGKLTDRFEPRIVVGVPDAVARLVPQHCVIDRLCLSIPLATEGYSNPEWYEAAGYCVDRLLLAWLTHTSSGRAAFEDLSVACDLPAAHLIFEQRGFVGVDADDSESYNVTHQARLPAAIISYEALSSSSDTSRGERIVYDEILRALRSQHAPGRTQNLALN